MSGLLKRAGFKSLEAVAEFIMYMPWMFLLYYAIFGDKKFFEFLPFMILFLLAGLFVTDYLLLKYKSIYKVSAYLFGLIAVSVMLAILWMKEGPFFAVLFGLYLIICYIRGVFFAVRDIRISFTQSKFISGIVVLAAAFAFSFYFSDTRWFSRDILWCAIAFIAASIIILNQLQLLRMLDMMNAEAYTTHRDVRLRNLIFSLILIGIIVLAFEIKAVVNFMSWVAIYIGIGLRYVIYTVIKWIFNLINSLYEASSGGEGISAPDLSQLGNGETSAFANILRIIMEVMYYITAVAIAIFLIYLLIKMVKNWIVSMTGRYVNADEERKFVFDTEEITGKKPSLADEMRRRMKHMLRRFETPQQYVRFIYAQIVKKFADRGCEIKPQQTPDDIYYAVKTRCPDVDPDFAYLTELYKKARYSPYSINDDDIVKAKRYKSRLNKLKI